MTLPDTLAEKIALFRDSGLVIREEDELFLDDSWGQVMIGQGIMRAVHRCLRPGGTYLFITVNGAHYFTIAAKTMKRLRVDEVMLRILRGRQEVDEYHYPVQYRFNRTSVIDRAAGSRSRPGKAQNPSLRSCFGSRCQSLAILTCRSR